MRAVKLDCGKKARELVFEYVDDDIKKTQGWLDKLNALLDEVKITVYFVQEVVGFPNEEKPSGFHNQYKIVVSRNDSKISFDYYGSTADLHTGKHPDLYSLLTCIKSDYQIPDSFEEFCSEFGYSTDSIRAEKIFKASVLQSAKLKQIFTEDEIELLPQ